MVAADAAPLSALRHAAGPCSTSGAGTAWLAATPAPPRGGRTGFTNQRPSCGPGPAAAAASVLSGGAAAAATLPAAPDAPIPPPPPGCNDARAAGSLLGAMCGSALGAPHQSDRAYQVGCKGGGAEGGRLSSRLVACQ